jgi:Flp pilus assembly protein TadB
LLASHPFVPQLTDEEPTSFTDNGNPKVARGTLPNGSTRIETFRKGDSPMLWTLFVILLIAWLVGLIGFHVIAWYIHVLLVLALVVLIIQLITGRRAAL